LIHIGVGCDENGKAYDSENKTLRTLKDRANPYEKLFESTGRFPYVYIPCYPIGQIWGMPLVVNLIPLQDTLNFCWVKLMRNVKKVIVPREIWSGRAGIKKFQLTDADGENVILDQTCPIRPSDAVFVPPIPNISDTLIKVIELTKSVFQDVSGLLEILRGTNPSGVTAGVALSQLGNYASSRPAIMAEKIGDGFKKVREMLAYIAQDFDANQFTIPDQSAEEIKYRDYNPEQTNSVRFQVTGTRRKEFQELSQMLLMMAQLKKEGIDPEILLRYEDDPSILKLYMDIKKSQEQAAAQQMQVMQAVEQQKQQHETSMKREGNALEMAKIAMQSQQRNNGNQSSMESKPTKSKEG